jgi:hypothetical protein
MSDIENVGAGRKYETPLCEYDAEHGKHEDQVEKSPPKLPQEEFPKVPDPSPFVLGK